MLESAWLMIGVIALCATAVALSTKTQAAGLYGSDDGVAIFSGIVGFISWGYMAYGTLQGVKVVGDAVTYTFQMPAVTYFCIMMALVPGYIALTGPAEMIHSRYRNPESKDV